MTHHLVGSSPTPPKRGCLRIQPPNGQKACAQLEINLPNLRGTRRADCLTTMRIERFESFENTGRADTKYIRARCLPRPSHGTPSMSFSRSTEPLVHGITVKNHLDSLISEFLICCPNFSAVVDIISPLSVTSKL